MAQGSFSLLGPETYARTGHYLDGAPFAAVDALSFYAGYSVYSKDYQEWSGPVAKTTSQLTGWILNGVNGAGALSALSINAAATEVGALQLKTGTANNDDALLQLAGEPWKYVVGKRIWFTIRVKTTTVNKSGLFFGLAKNGLTAVPGTNPTEGIYFLKATTDTKMTFHVRNAGVSTSVTLLDPAVLVDNTYREYSFVVDASGAVSVYVDQVLATSVATGNANFPTTQALALYYGVISSADATARDIFVSHVLVAGDL